MALLPPAVVWAQTDAPAATAATDGAASLGRSGQPTGWHWAGRVHKSDILTILPAILPASLAALGSLVILPIYLKRRDFAFALIVALQFLLIAIAALSV